MTSLHVTFTKKGGGRFYTCKTGLPEYMHRFIRAPLVAVPRKSVIRAWGDHTITSIKSINGHPTTFVDVGGKYESPASPAVISLMVDDPAMAGTSPSKSTPQHKAPPTETPHTIDESKFPPLARYPNLDIIQTSEFYDLTKEERIEKLGGETISDRSKRLKALKKSMEDEVSNRGSMAPIKIRHETSLPGEWTFTIPLGKHKEMLMGSINIDETEYKIRVSGKRVRNTIRTDMFIFPDITNVSFDAVPVKSGWWIYDLPAALEKYIGREIQINGIVCGILRKTPLMTGMITNPNVPSPIRQGLSVLSTSMSEDMGDEIRADVGSYKRTGHKSDIRFTYVPVPK